MDQGESSGSTPPFHKGQTLLWPSSFLRQRSTGAASNTTTSSLIRKGRALKKPLRLRKPMRLRRNTAKREELILVISPACDLLRCTLDQKVLCVKGRVVRSSHDLSDFFGQDHIYGKNRHLIRSVRHNQKLYMVVDWDEEDVTTIDIEALKNKKTYRRLARLNELFCHEIKEKSLRKLGRIGVQVDPSLTRPLSAAIKFDINKKSNCIRAPKYFVSGMLLHGNHNNAPILVISTEFRDWLTNEVESNYANAPKPLLKFIQYSNDSEFLEFPLKSNSKLECAPLNGAIKIRYEEKFDQAAFTSTSGFEMVVFPWE